MISPLNTILHLFAIILLIWVNVKSTKGRDYLNQYFNHYLKTEKSYKTIFYILSGPF